METNHRQALAKDAKKGKSRGIVKCLIAVQPKSPQNDAPNNVEETNRQSRAKDKPGSNRNFKVMKKKDLVPPKNGSKKSSQRREEETPQMSSRVTVP
ncbi:hypothetical protein DD238_008386 [Peronospora effusa]|uniref:Uncharacterized protein n=1 Tax=Peronospora effusa TaxID=542832 RepID=A0A3M6V7H5_9STRA|nr:hypothetical protein DD238_008386 [Peronospora effusa]RQM09324.1 hypothetical protein DD237_008453 [Peronospora effusa]